MRLLQSVQTLSFWNRSLFQNFEATQLQINLCIKLHMVCGCGRNSCLPLMNFYRDYTRIDVRTVALNNSSFIDRTELSLSLVFNSASSTSTSTSSTAAATPWEWGTRRFRLVSSLQVRSERTVARWETTDTSLTKCRSTKHNITQHQERETTTCRCRRSDCASAIFYGGWFWWRWTGDQWCSRVMMITWGSRMPARCCRYRRIFCLAILLYVHFFRWWS